MEEKEVDIGNLINKTYSNLKNFIVKNKIFFSYFVIFILIYSIWLLAFYPGALSYDSIYQWEQVQKFEFSALTVPLHTYLIYLLSRIWNNPAVVSIFQILFTSFLFAYFLDFFVKQKISKKIVNLVFIVLAISPVFGIYNVTPWKDVFYTQLILLLGTIWVKDCIRGYVENNNFKLILFSIAVVVTSLMRLNGLIYLVIIPLLYYFTKLINFKTLIKISVFVGVAYFLLGIIFPKIINVKNSENIGAWSRQVPIQMITAVAKFNGAISEESLETLNKVADLEQLKKAYNCAGIDYLLINTKVDLGLFLTDQEFTLKFDKMAIETIAKNFPIVLSDRVCLFSHLIGLGSPRWINLYYTDVYPNTNGIEQNGIPYLNTTLKNYLDWSDNYPQRIIFWMPIIYILIYLFYLIKSIYQHNRLVFGYTIIVLINLPILFIVNVFAAYRYVYMIPYGFFFLILIDIIKKKKR